MATDPQPMATDGNGAGPSDKPYTFTGRVAYASEQEAAIVRNTLAVDPELRSEQVSKQLTVEGTDLVMHFAATDVRTLRAAVGTFCDLLALATRTLEAFPPKAAAAAAAAPAAAAAAAATAAVAQQ